MVRIFWLKSCWLKKKILLPLIQVDSLQINPAPVAPGRDKHDNQCNQAIIICTWLTWNADPVRTRSFLCAPNRTWHLTRDRSDMKIGGDEHSSINITGKRSDSTFFFNLGHRKEWQHPPLLLDWSQSFWMRGTMPLRTFFHSIALASLSLPPPPSAVRTAQFTRNHRINTYLLGLCRGESPIHFSNLDCDYQP